MRHRNQNVAVGRRHVCVLKPLLRVGVRRRRGRQPRPLAHLRNALKPLPHQPLPQRNQQLHVTPPPFRLRLPPHAPPLQIPQPLVQHLPNRVLLPQRNVLSNPLPQLNIALHKPNPPPDHENLPNNRVSPLAVPNLPPFDQRQKVSSLKIIEPLLDNDQNPQRLLRPLVNHNELPLARQNVVKVAPPNPPLAPKLKHPLGLLHQKIHNSHQLKNRVHPLPHLISHLYRQRLNPDLPPRQPTVPKPHRRLRQLRRPLGHPFRLVVLLPPPLHPNLYPRNQLGTHPPLVPRLWVVLLFVRVRLQKLYKRVTFDIGYGTTHTYVRPR